MLYTVTELESFLAVLCSTVGQKVDCVGVAAATDQSGSKANPLCGIATSTNVRRDLIVRVLCAWHSYSAWSER